MTNRRLPAKHIFTRALSLIWEKKDFAFRIAGPLILFNILIGLALNAGYFTEFVNPETMSAPKNIEHFLSRGFLIALCLQIIQGLLLGIIAVFWHRNILLHETQAPALPLRFDGVMWRYIGYGVLVFLIITLIMFLGAAVFAVIMLLSGGMRAAASLGKTGSIILTVLFLIPLSLWLLVLVFRFSLVLPAAAIGRRGFGFRTAWTLSRGNGWPILKIHLLGFILGIIIGLVLIPIQIGFGYVTGGGSIWLHLLANTFINYILVLLGVGVLSLSYAYLTHEQPPQGTSLEVE